MESGYFKRIKQKPKCHFGLQNVRVHDLVKRRREQEQEEEKEEEEEEGGEEVQKSGMPLS